MITANIGFSGMVGPEIKIRRSGDDLMPSIRIHNKGDEWSAVTIVFADVGGLESFVFQMQEALEECRGYLEESNK